MTQDEIDDLPDSTFYGTIGDRITIRLYVMRDDPVYNLIDPLTGCLFTWFDSHDDHRQTTLPPELTSGKYYTLTATISKHKEWADEDRTILTNVRLATPKEAASLDAN